MINDNEGRDDDDDETNNGPDDPREVVEEEHRLLVLVEELTVDVDGDSLVVVVAVYPNDVIDSVHDGEPAEHNNGNDTADNKRAFWRDQPFNFERHTDTQAPFHSYISCQNNGYVGDEAGEITEGYH